MKKIFFPLISGLVITVLLGSCTKFNDQFNGLDSMTKPTNLVTYNYQMVDADYAAIGTAVQKPITALITPIQASIAVYQDSLKNHAANKADSARLNASITTLNGQITTLKLDTTYVMGASVTANKYLPKKVLSANYIPLWLNTKYLYADENSATKLTYNAEYDTSIIATTNKYTLKAGDYTTMKVTTGSFSSTVSPTYFIPIWLKQNFPYAKVGDIWLIHYKYYVSSTSTVNQWLVCVYDGTNWSKNGFTTPKVVQYSFKAGTWVLDPTVSFTMSKADYQLIVNATKADPATAKYVDAKYGDNESYYGSSAYYGEFNIQLAPHSTQPEFAGLSTDAANALIWDRVRQGLILMLKSKFPLATAQVNGIDVHYKVTYDVYVSSMVYYVSDFKCTSDGTSTVAPDFELSSGPTPL